MNECYGKIAVTFAAMCLACQLAQAQDIGDLLERVAKDSIPKPKNEKDVRMTRNDLSLSLRPGLDLGRKSDPLVVGFNADLDWNFSCGQFDIQANLRHLFTKEALENGARQLMDVAQGELAASGLTLLCSSSPLLCEVFKTHRFSAQALLFHEYDKCARIEQAIDTAQKKSRAASIQRCISEKVRRGVPIERANEECEKGELSFGDLMGERTLQVSILDQLTKVFKLDPETTRDAQLLLGDTTTSSKRMSGTADPEGAERRFGEIKQKYRREWDLALDQIRSGGALSMRQIQALLPYDDMQMLWPELNSLAYADPEDQEIVKESLISQVALTELVRRINNIERYLEAAEKLPGAAENPELYQLKESREKLIREKARLKEEYAAKANTQETLVEILHALRALKYRKANRANAKARGLNQGQDKLNEIPAPGRNPMTSASRNQKPLIGGAQMNFSGSSSHSTNSTSSSAPADPCCGGQETVYFGK